MDIDKKNLDETFLNFIMDYIEEIKELLSSDIWENIFLNCSKNEVFIFWLLYRKNEVNMTEAAEYIHVPLNTATGIIGRMERNGLVVRTRSKEDKRVVKIEFSEQGKSQFESLINQILYYGFQIIHSFTKEEMDVLYKMTTKTIEVLKQDRKKTEPKKVRKIRID